MGNKVKCSNNKNNNNNNRKTIALCGSNYNVELGNSDSVVDDQDEWIKWRNNMFGGYWCELSCLPSDSVIVSGIIQTEMKRQNHPKLKSAYGNILQIVGSIELT